MQTAPTFFYSSKSNLEDRRILKQVTQIFDKCKYVVCYCESCCKHFAMHNRYQQYLNLCQRVARKSKYAIHDFQKRQTFFMNKAVFQTKEAFIKSINDNDSRLITMCPKCMLEDYKIIFEIMDKKEKEVIELSDVHVFEKQSLIEINQLINDIYLLQLFAGYVNVSDLRRDVQEQTKEN